MSVMGTFFGFPNPVNQNAARVVAAGVVVLASIAVATHAWWLTIPLAYGFAARVAAGPRLSPLGQVATRVIAPAFPPRPVPGPPKRFAQALGAALSLSAMCCWLAGAALATEVLLAVLLVPATLEAGLGYCMGCELFAFGMRVGLVPESVCEACADLFGPAAARRRAAAGNP